MNYESTIEARATCYNCFRPVGHCLCASLKPFDAHTNLLILQHPNERKKYYSTAKLVVGSIRNSKLIRGIDFPEEQLQKILSQGNHYLLYPGTDSQDCESLDLNENHTVIALDGTWSEAGKILNRNPILKSLPKVSFNRNLKSEYRIRKQPKDRYLSTLESIGYLLKLNAVARGFGNYSEKYNRLFQAFTSMVEKQLVYLPNA